MMDGLYTRYYGNSRHSGYIEAECRAGGDTAWTRVIDDNRQPRAEARLVLSIGEVLIVDGMREIFAFGSEGQRLWRRPKWPGSQVALQDELIYFTSAERKTRMEAVDLNGAVKIRNFRMPDVGEDAGLVLFEPVGKGLIAQVEYASKPDQITAATVVYQTTGKNPGYDWCRGYQKKTSPLIPLVCPEVRRLVTTLPGEVLVFDLDAEEIRPEPVARFSMPLEGRVSWISGGADGRLYWAGHGEEGLSLAVTDMSGEAAWQWQSGEEPLHKRHAFAPPNVTADRVYMLTPKNLLALNENGIIWNFPSIRGEFRHGTALSDNSILVTTWDTVYLLNAEGEIVFDEIVDEPLVTAPVVSQSGNVFVAGAERLYAIA